jgi:hypothetical protein
MWLLVFTCAYIIICRMQMFHTLPCILFSVLYFMHNVCKSSTPIVLLIDFYQVCTQMYYLYMCYANYAQLLLYCTALHMYSDILSRLQHDCMCVFTLGICYFLWINIEYYLFGSMLLISSLFPASMAIRAPHGLDMGWQMGPTWVTHMGPISIWPGGETGPAWATHAGPTWVQ